MRLLFVIDSLGAGGAERSTAALLPVLAGMGAEVQLATLYSVDEGSEDEVRRSGFDVRQLKSTRFAGRVRELRQLIRTETPDIVHTALFAADVVGRLAAAGTRSAVVSTLTSVPRSRRDGRNGTLPWKLRVVDVVDTVTARLFADRLHAVTPGVARLTAEAHPMLRGRIGVVERGRSRENLGERSPERRSQARNELGIDNRTPIVLAIGRQEHQKAHGDLILSLEHLLEWNSEVRLLIAGRRGEASQSLDHLLLKRPDLAHRVSLLGHRDDVGDLLVAADVLVSSSLHEGAAGVVIEAMALKTPIVSTNVEGLEGVLSDETNALLTPIRDPLSLARAIQRILADDSLGHRLAAAAYQDFEHRFTIERSAERMMQFYRSVLAEGQH